jgi:hypothetical protein
VNVSDALANDIDWFWVTIFLSIFAPLGGCILMWFLKLGMGSNASFVVDWFAPYRDGQLGYVVVGWIAAAILEISQFTEKADAFLAKGALTAQQYADLIAGSHGWSGKLNAACFIIGALSALCSANGAANSVKVSAAAVTRRQLAKKYASFLQSTVLLVVGYVVVNSVHNHVIGVFK